MGGTSSKVEPFSGGVGGPVAVNAGSTKSDAARPVEAVGAHQQGNAAWPFPSVDAAREAGKSEGEILAFLRKNNLELADGGTAKDGETTTTTTATKEILRFPGAGVEDDEPALQLAGDALKDNNARSPQPTTTDSPSLVEKRASIRESPSVRKLLGQRKSSSVSEASSV